MTNIEKLKRKIIKKANLDSVAKTEEIIKKYLSKMNYSQLLTTECFVEGQQNKKGISDANILFLKLIREEIDKRE